MASAAALVGSAVAATVAEGVYALRNGNMPLPIRAVTTAYGAALRLSNPALYSNHGDSPTVEQIAAWERKVGRAPSLRPGLHVVRRVQTTPYEIGRAHV